MSIKFCVTLAVVALVAVCVVGGNTAPSAVAPADNLVVRINRHIFANAPKPPSSTPMSRVNSISMLAMHEVINSIQPVYKTHYGGVRVRNNHGASIPAAILGAFNTTRQLGMMNLPDSYFADQILFNETVLAPYTNALSAFMQTELAALAAAGVSSDAIEKGLNLGRQAGLMVLALREDDGYNVPAPIQDGPCGIEGQWCSFSEDQTNPRRGAGYPNWGGVKPFSFGTASEFTVPPPFQLSDHLFQASLNSTRLYGSSTNNQIVDTAFLNEVKVWGMGAGGELGARIVDSMFTSGGAEHMSFSLFDTVALFGRLYVGNCDALINNLYNKYKYNSWRPYQAIRQTVDPNWLPFMKTPVNQEYPCGHCEGTAGALVGVQLTLEPLFESDKFPFGPVQLVVPAAPATPTFASFSNVIQHVNAARRFGGMHFDFSVQQGSMYGTRIATHIFNTMFQKSD